MIKDTTKKQLSINEKERIVKIYYKGYKIVDISYMFDISERTINRIIKKYNEEKFLERKEGTGTKTKYCLYDVKNKLIKIIKTDRSMSLDELKNKLLKNYNIQYSRSGIHRILKEELHFVKKKATMKIPLTEEQLNNRQYWTIFYQYFNWDIIIWSDETTICNDPNSYQKIWYQEDEQIIKCKYKYPNKINLWGRNNQK